MKKLSGGGVLPPGPKLIHIIKGIIGGTLGIYVLSYLSQFTEEPWLIAPFGATCVLLFAVPTSPLAQPRNVIGGHFITALVGLTALYLFGDSMLVLSLAVGIAIGAMQYTRTLHPPAGANPIVIMIAGQQAVGFDFLLMPVLSGSIVLVMIASLLNNASKEERWPYYWHGFSRQKE